MKMDSGDNFSIIKWYLYECALKHYIDRKIRNFTYSEFTLVMFEHEMLKNIHPRHPTLVGTAGKSCGAKFQGPELAINYVGYNFTARAFDITAQISVWTRKVCDVLDQH